MITAIRNHARSWVVKVLLGVISVTFVISFGVGQFAADKLVLVKIGGEEILVSQYTREYERELDRLRQRYPENAEVFAQQLNLRKQVYDRIVNRHLILKAAESSKFFVSDAEVSDSITSQPGFHVENRFDVDTYRYILNQNRLTPEKFEERTRQDLQLEKYQRNLMAGLVVAQAEIDERYRIENEKVEVEAFQMEAAKFRKEVKSDVAAEKAYYESHKKVFTQPEQYRIEFFVLPLAKVEPAVKVKERAIKRFFERNQEAKYTTPKQVRASHILKKVPQDAPAETMAKVRKEMEKIVAEAKKGGDFAKLAARHSEDYTKDKGGDLGFFEHEEMLPEFSDAAFSLEPGNLSGIVRTNFGLHLIKVTEVKPAVVKGFEEVKAEIEKDLIAQRAERKLGLEADRLPRRIGKEGIEAAAREYGLKATTSPWFDNRKTIPGVGSSAPLHAQLRTRKVGDSGVWRRNPVQGHVFYKILEKKAASLKPFGTVRKQAAQKVIAERSEEAAVAAAKAAFKNIKTYQGFKAAAKKRSAILKTTSFTAIEYSVPEIGTNKEFQQAAFRLSKEKPFGLSIKNKTAHLLFLKRRFLPKIDKEQEAKQQIETRLNNEWAQYFIDKEIERLKVATEIEVITPEIAGTL